jgi:AAHS family cis,cis-muconate transporter-like MFS transporter
MVVFVACFLGLVVDGMDLIMLSITMPSLMEEFNIGKADAGLIATWSLVGMAVGGIGGGWLSDRFGRVRMATSFHFCYRNRGGIYYRYDAYG